MAARVGCRIKCLGTFIFFSFRASLADTRGFYPNPAQLPSDSVRRPSDGSEEARVERGGGKEAPRLPLGQPLVALAAPRLRFAPGRCPARRPKPSARLTPPPPYARLAAVRLGLDLDGTLTPQTSPSPRGSNRRTSPRGPCWSSPCVWAPGRSGARPGPAAGSSGSTPRRPALSPTSTRRSGCTGCGSTG